MRQNYKIKLLEDIEQLALYFSDDMYEKVLEKVLNSKDVEVIYIFKSKIESAPTQTLGNKIMEYKEYADLLDEIKKDTWRIKFARDFGNINLIDLWLKIRSIYDYRYIYEEYKDFDIEEVNRNLLLFSTIKGAPVNDIYDFLKTIDGASGDLMKKFLNSGIELNLDLIISQFASLDVYNGDHPKDIYHFVLNYYQNISCEQMDKIISILHEKLQDYYYLIELSNSNQFRYYNGDEALDILVLFLTNIKSLTILQKRELVRDSLKKKQSVPSSYMYEKNKREIEEQDRKLELEELKDKTKAKRFRENLPSRVTGEDW